MSGEDVEVCVELLHVDRHVRHRLCAVHQHGDAVCVRFPYDFPHRVHRSECVGDVRHGYEFCLFRDELVQLVHLQHTVRIERNDLQADVPILLLQLPRDNVGVVLHLRDDDLVTVLALASAEGGDHQVDGFGRAAGEDDLAGIFRVDELPHGLAGRFVGFCRLLAQEMHAAMDVRVVVQIVLADLLHHAERFLGRRRIVHVDKRFAVYLFL